PRETGCFPLPSPRLNEMTCRQTEAEFLRMSIEINFGYLADCCLSRAHKMFRLLGERDFKCRKIWVFRGSLIRSWKFHVALVVNVREADGSLREAVIDPA